MPSTIPRAPPSRPSRNASPTTDHVIWRLLAPIARSSASSRVRRATSIEKVLRMMKVPTNRAMNAKTSRKVLMNPSAVLSCSAASSWSSCPVLTL